MPYLGNYTGAPSTNPASQNQPYLRDSATPSAFGINVDEANQQLGQQIAKTGNVVQEFGNNLQDQYNTAALADIDNQYIRATAQRTAEFNQLQGKAALDARPDYEKFITDTKDQVLSGAPNGAVARAAGLRLDRSANALIVDSTRHVVGETKRYAQDELRSGIQLTSDQAGQDVDNLDKFSLSLAKSKAQTEQLYQTQGFTPDSETTKLAVRTEAAKNWQNRFTTLTQYGRADQAMKEYDAHRDEILDPGDKVHDAIYSGQTSQFVSGQSRRLAAGFASPDAVANAIYGQESTYGKNAKTSVDDARGPMQIIPATFERFAKEGENIDNPKDNKKVGDRMIQQFYQQYNGDAERVAVAYFSGEGNVAPAGSPTPWKNDTHDGTGKYVSQYVPEVMAKMQKNTLAQATPTAITGLVQQARAEAVQQFPDDPKIADQAEAAVRQRFNLVKQDFTLAKQEAVYTARDAIFAKTDQDPQARPDRWDELMQNQTFKAQIDTLNGQPNGAQEVAKLQGLVNRNVLNVPSSPERDERFQELKGMANDNPQGFRNVDLSQEDLTRLQMSELHHDQRKMNDASRADPNLARVKQVLDNDKFFQKIGMLKGTDKEPNQDYIKFMGALNAQAAVWQARGKPPTDQEVKDFAAMLITPSSQAWGAKPFYQQPVPPDMRDTIVQRFKDRKQATPTEGEISRIYNDLFYNRAVRNRPAINEELARRAGKLQEGRSAGSTPTAQWDVGTGAGAADLTPVGDSPGWMYRAERNPTPSTERDRSTTQPYKK